MSASTWYQHTSDASAVSPRVAERALEWLVELQCPPVPPETIAAWQQWRAAHPDHERAWQRIESVRGRLQPLYSPVSSAIAQAALAPRDSPSRRRIVKTLAVTLFAGGAAWGASELAPWHVWSADYRTGIGERRTLALADGTQLMINTGSAADVAYGATERRVRLMAGELLATTAKDAAARPFLVETAHGTAHALGTRYTVRLLDNATEVRVFEGAVRIEPRHAGPAGAAVVLQAGQQACFSATAVDTVDPTDSNALGWIDGFIVARSMRLDDFLAELGRYSRDNLSCDPAVAGLKVSGSFPVADVSRVIDTVAGTLALRADVRERFWGARHVRLMPMAPGPRS